MSTIAKERVAEFIKNPLDNGLTRGEQMELARIALASLEAEKIADPVAFINEAWTLVYYRPPKELGLKIGDKLYTAPPAKVSVPTFEEWCKRTEQKPVGWVHDAMKEAYDACRAAMLQGASGNSPVIPDWQAKAEKLAELHGTSFVVFRNGESPQCADPSKVIISFTDEGLGHSETGNFREISNSSTNNFRENAETSTKCWCHTCRPVTFADSRFVVCPDCGNKRCPHANDHRNACTASNEPGQEGSAYPAASQQE